ncbi:MAG: hypothetical protein R2697_05670 [Ilumatobacteraceae bacterium]
MTVADVLTDGDPGDVRPGVVDGDVARRTPDDDDEFDLVVDGRTVDEATSAYGPVSDAGNLVNVAGNSARSSCSPAWPR